MRGLLRSISLVALALAVPIVPFLLVGGSVEERVARWVDSVTDRPRAALFVSAVLATDILLPVPSSVVSTAGGAKLGVLAGTLASWVGMTAGACIGFAVARFCGRPIVLRLTSREELLRIERLTESLGPAVLVLTRALPVLAEASVLWFGAARLNWRRFLGSVALSNVGIALAYSAFGSYAHEHGATAAALGASVVLPLAGLVIVRLLVRADRPANA